MLLSTGNADAAVSAAVRLAGPSTVSMRGEILAGYAAVALACTGRLADADAAATAATSLTQSSEIVVLTECVRAMTSIQNTQADALRVRLPCARHSYAIRSHRRVICDLDEGFPGFRRYPPFLR